MFDDQRNLSALMLSYPAQRVYDTLVSLVGATDDESNRLQWEHFWKERGDYREYRFIGNLGFGGKFYSDSRGRGWRVDCYPEHRTPDREAWIEAVNEALANVERELVEDGQLA